MTVETLRIEQDAEGSAPGCVTVWLGDDPGAVVVLNEGLIRRLDATLDALPDGMTGFVLASASQRVFVAGADLSGIQSWDDERLSNYLAAASRVFGRISDLPCWSAAAINGAALGGGLEIAMHCDALIGVPEARGKAYPIGLPEAGLAICPGWGGTNLLPARIDPRDAIERTAVGTPMTSIEAVAAGLFDQVAQNSDELIASAKAWVTNKREQGAPTRGGAPSRWIGTPDRSAAAAEALSAFEGAGVSTPPASAVVKAVRAGLEEGWRAALKSEQASLVQLRHTPAAVEAIRAFFERSKK